MTQTATELITKEDIAAGVVHEMPADLAKALTSDDKVLAKWRDITPLARNEWICWTVNVKTDGTRAKHVQRAKEELLEGKRRPCCWIGCIHRKDKSMSASQKWVTSRQSKKS